MEDNNGAIVSTASLSKVHDAVFLCCLTSSEIGSFVNLPQIVPEHDSEDGNVVVDVDKVDDRGPIVVIKVDEAVDDVFEVVVVEDGIVVAVEVVAGAAAVVVDAVLATLTLTELQTTLSAQSQVLISSLKRVPSAQV